MPNDNERPDINDVAEDSAESAIENATGEDEGEHEYEFTEDGLEPVGEIEVEVVDMSFGAHLS